MYILKLDYISTEKKNKKLTNKMIPFKTSFESTPTLRSSRHSLSNFSGVSLLSMLMKSRKDKDLKLILSNNTATKINSSFVTKTLQKKYMICRTKANTE